MSHALKDKDWSTYIRDVILRETTVYAETVTQRLLRTFETLDDEVNERANRSFGEATGDDPGAAADNANDEAINWGMEVASCATGLTGLFAVGLFHLFEQHADYLYSECERKQPPRFWIPKTLSVWLTAGHFDMTTATGWTKVQELKHVANTIKHAEGDSCSELRKINPDLFNFPAFRSTEINFGALTKLPVRRPLAGEDIYITEETFKEYVEAVSSFWTWLADEIDSRIRSY